MDRCFESLGRRAKRKRIFNEQDGRCLWCGLDSWLGKPIELEIDHIDGNRRNEARNNLRGLCPNCHAQTPTYNFTGRRHTEKAKQKLRQIALKRSSQGG